MSSLFRDYNPRTVLVPATAICILLITGLIAYLRSQNTLGFQPNYISFLLLGGGMLLLTSFFLFYNAAFLQLARLQTYGYVVSSLLFAVAVYYILAGMFPLTGTPSIDGTLQSYWYASMALVLMTFLAEFRRLIKFVIAFSLAMIALSLITSRTLLTPEVVRSVPALERFLDISFWNLTGVITVVFSAVLAFLSANLLFEQLKKK